MGIPRFTFWFRNYKLTRKCITKKINNCDVLAIDMNGLIYNNDGIFDKIWKDIVRLVNEIKPKRKLIITVDGVPPVGKIQNQRKRRFLNFDEDFPAAVDTNKYSPGTEYMFDLDSFLKSHIIRIGDVNKRNPEEELFPPAVIYSSHLQPGEGEHKIVEFLRKESHYGQTLVVHGSDSDLILINSLLLKKSFKNIFLFREADITEIINIKTLCNILMNSFKSEHPINDFVILVTLLGNDFLPHFPILSHITRVMSELIESYIEYTKKFPNQGICGYGEIIWNNLKNYLNYFYKTRFKAIKQAWIYNLKYPGFRENVPFQTPSKFQKLYSDMDPPDADKIITREWYIQALFGTPDMKVNIANKEIVRMCDAYLTTLQWVYNYYEFGVRGLNLDWYYPYHYTPLFFHLVWYMNKIDDFSNMQWGRKAGFGELNFKSNFEHLVMILPTSSLEIVPNSLKKFYQKDSPIYDLFPSKFPIDEKGHNVGYIKIPFIPIPDPRRIAVVFKTLQTPRLLMDDTIMSITQKTRQVKSQSKTRQNVGVIQTQTQTVSFDPPELLYHKPARVRQELKREQAPKLSAQAPPFIPQNTIFNISSNVPTVNQKLF